MAETETITVAEVSDGFGAGGDTGREVTLPVVELLTGRGFVTGKSGSGKSNSASVIAEKLLDNGFGLLIVDIDGEYYGLKEEYEILHAGADDECDIQVTTDHAEKLATLALEQNVPIILDVSSYLDESEAEEVLTAVARRLFAKAKKQKQPFLLLVEEVHEYIPEKGSVGECGKMLIKIGKRGRKHGLGICGISQRPADVKKDFITQCDWLLWHRLTWNNDTKVVSRILDGEYADAVEGLDDGEGFLMTDWAEIVRRVQFYRKQTFDAGATPGLDDFERPDLKSVSDDLVSELEEISEEKQARENRIQELREELDRKNSRIAELERELQDARDLSQMADQFVDSLVRHVEGHAPGRTERERLRSDWKDRTLAAANGDPTTSATSNGSAASASDGGLAVEEGESTQTGPADEQAETAAEDGGQEAFAAMMNAVETTDEEEWSGTATEESKVSDTQTTPETDEDGEHVERDSSGVEPEQEKDNPRQFSADRILESLNNAKNLETEDVLDGGTVSYEQTPREEIESALRSDAEFVDAEPEARSSGSDVNGETPSADLDEEPLVVRELKAEIGGMETKTRKMLAFYQEFGPGTALNAHFAAGGDGDRTKAYAHNRKLRTRGLIEHVGRGRYDYRLRELLREEFDRYVDTETLDEYAAHIESKMLDVTTD